MGPMPRHQISGHRIRFELQPNVWGDWIDMAQYNFANGGGVSEERVMQLVHAGGSDHDQSVTVEYVSATDNRPVRVVRDDTEDRFDWGTSGSGTHQYKGTAAVGTGTSEKRWTIWRTTLDSNARASIRARLDGVAWDNRVTLSWP